MRAFLAVALLAFVSANEVITCPTIACDSALEEADMCYLHSGDNPVSYLRFYPCESGYRCDIEEDRNAWITSQK